MEKETAAEQDEDLGLGSKVIAENHSRFVNRDGTLNVHKKGSIARGTFSLYHAILNASWFKFYAGILVFYFLANSFFTWLYTMAGKTAFPELAGLAGMARFGKLFFYSVQVITTLGSSPLHPESTGANILLSLEAMVGLLSFSLIAGLIFARFSNPAVKISFSNKAIIAPYNNGVALMFRIINERNNELADVSATVTLSLEDAKHKRSFHRLTLERDKVSSFPLSWTIVHPITASSPLRGFSLEDFARAETEVLVNITATDVDLSKEVYTRFSYLYNEVVYGARFKYIFEYGADGSIIVDPKRIHEIESVKI